MKSQLPGSSVTLIALLEDVANVSARVVSLPQDFQQQMTSFTNASMITSLYIGTKQTLFLLVKMEEKNEP